MSLPTYDPAVLASYQTRGSPRDRTRAAVVVTGGFALLLAFSFTASGPTSLGYTYPPIALFAVCLSVVWYSALFGVYRLEMTQDSLRWRSLIRRGEVPLTELRRIRNRGSKWAVIERDNGRRISISMREGFPKFADDVRRAAPNANVSIAPPPADSSGYRRYDGEDPT